MKNKTTAIWLAATIGLAFAGLGHAAEAKPASTGYVVNVELLIGETGAVAETKIVSSDDEVLSVVALKIAEKMSQPIRKKDGVAVKYRVIAPLAFPVEGDGGPEVQKAPQPKMRTQPQPVYPREEARTETPGGVILELSIDEKGKVTDAKVVRASNAEFGRAAAQAARNWTFVPLVVDGKETAVHLFQAVTFDVSGKRPDWRWYVAPRPCLPRFEISGMYLPAGSTLIRP